MTDDQLSAVERIVLEGLRRADPDAAAALASLDQAAQRRVLEQFNEPVMPDEPATTAPGPEAGEPQSTPLPEPGDPVRDDPPASDTPGRAPAKPRSEQPARPQPAKATAARASEDPQDPPEHPARPEPAEAPSPVMRPQPELAEQPEDQLEPPTEQPSQPSPPDPLQRSEQSGQSQATPTQPAGDESATPKRRTLRWIILVSVLIALAAGAVISYVLSSGDELTHPSATASKPAGPTTTSRPTVTVSATTTTRTKSLGDCYVGLRVQPGEGCRHPINNRDFIVKRDGDGSFGSTIVGSGIDIDASNVSFKASRQSDGSWRIERVARATVPPPPTTSRSLDATATTAPEGYPVTADVTDCTGVEEIGAFYSVELIVLVQVLRDVTALRIDADNPMLGRALLENLEEGETREVMLTGTITNPTDADCDVTVTWDE